MPPPSDNTLPPGLVLAKLLPRVVLVHVGHFRSVYALPTVKTHIDEVERENRKLHRRLLRVMQNYFTEVDHIIVNEDACRPLRYKEAKDLWEFKAHQLRVFWFLCPDHPTVAVCVHHFYKDDNSTDPGDIATGQNNRIALLNAVRK